ncbi:hypothetical protein, partial [Bradyrhizobium brasilense]|uniref:hypothetical protein n=1 Tax=Bradyrhizobium brasilense TaxID=1419277 RepID=UPI001E35F6A4
RAAPPAGVPTVAVASPAELDSLSKPKIIGGLMQAERSSDNCGMRATARRRHHRQCSRESEHPKNRFPHDFHLGS